MLNNILVQENTKQLFTQLIIFQRITLKLICERKFLLFKLNLTLSLEKIALKKKNCKGLKKLYLLVIMCNFLDQVQMQMLLVLTQLHQVQMQVLLATTRLHQVITQMLLVVTQSHQVLTHLLLATTQLHQVITQMLMAIPRLHQVLVQLLLANPQLLSLIHI